MTHTLTIGFMLCYFTVIAQGQDQKFNAGLVAGFNMAELEGDEITDFFGVNAGVFGTVLLRPRLQLGLELLFSQNGEYVLPEYYPQVEYGKVRLNHFEVPLHIDLLVDVNPNNTFSEWQLGVGIAYAWLVNYHAENVQKVDLTHQVIYDSREAILMQASTTYFINRRMGLNFKASLPLRKDALDWTLAARMLYRFS